MESMKSFALRVQSETGISLKEMPRAVRRKGDSRPLPGRIFAKRDHMFVVAVGYPAVDANGEETWPPTAFRLFVV